MALIMPIPIVLYSSKLVSDGASIPVTMFRNESSSENGVNGALVTMIHCNTAIANRVNLTVVAGDMGYHVMLDVAHAKLVHVTTHTTII